MFDAEGWLGGLDPVGWRFGLERIRALTTALGMPQHRFASAHVVGTNGKSSVTAMIGALLEAHGHTTGAYLSPHEDRWAERVQLRGETIGDERFAAAAERVAQAVPVVERRFEEGERITQFEAVTATAFVALAAARVEFGVIEAGLGGRLDATNVIPSRLTVLTSIGLEHTEWLGETEAEIAGEKLAVLRDHTSLIAGRLSPDVEELARATAAERKARFVAAHPAEGYGIDAPYLRANFGVALAAARELIGELDEARVRAALAALELPGRAEVIAGDPPLVLDAAHNPQGARALAGALRELAGDRPVAACVALLADKDHEGVARELAEVIEVAVCTEIPAEELGGMGRPGATSKPAAELAGAFAAQGVRTEAVADPRVAVARTIEAARVARGVALVCGSHYLLHHGRETAARNAGAA